MKSNDIKKLPANSVSELQQMATKLQHELIDLRMQKVLNKSKNVREYKHKRHDLARVKTILKVKQFSVSHTIN